MAEETNVSQHEFKAEVKQLLNILVHSLYTNREIFLRELISNASDALDKLRFESTRGTEVVDSDLPLEIRVTFDKDKKIIEITDTGVGMSQDEVIANIGTIAHSGSAEFLKKALEEKSGLDSLIGQFGVGFYSVFMVAKEVVLTTKSYRADEPAVQWKSDGLGTYELSNVDGGVKRGTRIRVQLMDDTADYADGDRLKDIIHRHSNFISFPVYVEDEQANTIPAIWREPKFNIKPEQYNEFYKFLTYDNDDPWETIHISVDAPVQYNSILFIPEKNYDFFGLGKERPGLDLYVRRILIQKGNKDLIPEYLGFIRGVVDSEDLPLNISRETLQENRALSKIASNIVKQILTNLAKVAKEDSERYDHFWKEHGRFFKLGYTDYANRDLFAELLRFNSSKSGDADALVSLDEYISRAKPDQKEIYFIFGHSREAIELNPHMEIFKSKGLEVLYLYEPLDEFTMESVREFKEFTLKSVEHVDLKSLEAFDSEPKDKEDVPPLSSDEAREFDNFLQRIQDILGDRVTAVKVSGRLSSSPGCLVNPDGGLTSSMQRVLQIASKDTSIPPKIFEINRDHRLIRNLFSIYQANPQDDYLTTAIEQLFESSLLMEGYLKDPHAMVNRIQKLLDRSSGWYLAVNKPK